jgi:hypothetical protein
VSVFLCVVLSCVGRGLGAGLIPRPRSPTKCLKGSISKKRKNPTPEKGTRNNEEEEEGIRRWEPVAFIGLVDSFHVFVPETEMLMK